MVNRHVGSVLLKLFGIPLFILLSGCFLDSRISKLDSAPSALGSGEIKITASSDFTVNEGDTLTIPIHFQSESSLSKTFSYASVGDTAVVNQHFLDTRGDLVVAFGETNTSIILVTKELGLVPGESKIVNVVLKNETGEIKSTFKVTILPVSQSGLAQNFSATSPKALQTLDMGSYYLFSKFFPGTASELWRSDGTAAGTFLVKSICSNCNSEIFNFVKVGSNAYFVAEEVSGQGYRIFKTDGTAGGTQKIFDPSQISTAADTSSEELAYLPQCPMNGSFCGDGHLVAGSDRIYFLQSNFSEADPFSLYSSQGTLGTTVSLNRQSTEFQFAAVFQDRFVGSRLQGTFRWDGAAPGGSIAITPGNACGGGSYSYPALVGADLFYSCLDSVASAFKVVKLDSSFAVTFTTIPIFLNSASVGDTYYYYSVADGVNYDIYRTNGTGVGTALVYNNAPFSSISFLGKGSGKTVFAIHGQIYTTTGTLGSTTLQATIAGFNNATNVVFPQGSLGTKVYFQALNKLYSFDTGTNTLVEVTDGGESITGAWGLFADATQIIIRGSTASRGGEVWKIKADYSVNLIAEVGAVADSSAVGQVFTFNSAQYFTDILNEIPVLYKINSDQSRTLQSVSNWGAPTYATMKSYLTAGNSFIWTEENRDAPTRLNRFAPSTGLEKIANVDTKTSYLARNSLLAYNDNYVLISSLGYSNEKGGTVYTPLSILNLATGVMSETSAPTIYSTANANQINGKTVFSAKTSPSFDFNFELYVSDGTTGGTGLLKEIEVGATGSWPTKMGTVANQLIYSSSQGLYATDGSALGTTLITNPSFTGGPASPLEWNGKIAFIAQTAANGIELWQTDGTVGGTKIIKDIVVGGGSGLTLTTPLKVFNNKLYFTADDGVSGLEIWTSDGTAAGTQILQDICGGACSSTLSKFDSTESRLYFWESVANGSLGTTVSVLWSSDGTAAGTEIVQDFRPKLLYTNSKATSKSYFFTLADDLAGDINRTVWRRYGTNAPQVLPGYQGSGATFLGVTSQYIYIKDLSPSYVPRLFWAK